MPDDLLNTKIQELREEETARVIKYARYARTLNPDSKVVTTETYSEDVEDAFRRGYKLGKNLPLG